MIAKIDTKLCKSVNNIAAIQIKDSQLRHRWLRHQLRIHQSGVRMQGL